MADTDTTATPMTDADVTSASTDTLRATPPVKQTGNAGDPPETSGGRTTDAKQAIRDGAGKVQRQAVEKAQGLAGDGKAKAVGALGQVSQLLNDAASDVDRQFGEQYGRYARSAAGTVTSLADTLQDKSVNELIEDARALVRRSPAVAIGAAAAIGFVAARLAQAGIDSDEA